MENNIPEKITIITCNMNMFMATGIYEKSSFQIHLTEEQMAEIKRKLNGREVFEIVKCH